MVKLIIEYDVDRIEGMPANDYLLQVSRMKFGLEEAPSRVVLQVVDDHGHVTGTPAEYPIPEVHYGS